MLNSDVKKIVMKYFALMLMVLALLLFSRDSTKALFATSQASRDGAQLPTITQADQGDAPLRIVHAFVETPSPEKVVVRVMVQNQSARQIRALAIASNIRVDFLNLSGRTSILLPSQIKTFDIVYTEDGRPKSINLSVDFVEFGDGTTWGADIANSRDRLAGQREGAKAERQRLKTLLKSKGRPALTELIVGEVLDELDPSTTANHSQEWQQGYRSGVAAIRYRLRQALQTNNQRQIELELNKPYDTSEVNNQ